MAGSDKELFDVSIIIAVYNTEQFLAEAIESVIHQDYGLERIQLILVDDGSSDGSPAICDDYKSRYPKNITVIHKENGGVAAARNTGLDVAAGTFVNFMDSDDRLSLNTVRKVMKFISVHEKDRLDVISFPMVFFDGRVGEHQLNYKFEQGSRVIDLEKEPDKIQLSSSSAFFRKNTIDTLNLRFDPKMKYAEDAKIVLQVLLQKKKMGAVADCQYEYRRRASGGSISAVQVSNLAKDWWLPYMQLFQLSVIDICNEKLGEVPSFVQFTLCYDLQWRVKQGHIPVNLLSDAEVLSFRQALKKVLQYIDDEIIIAQRQTEFEHKLYMLRTKYGMPGEVEADPDSGDLSFHFGEQQNAKVITRAEIQINRIDILKNELVIEAYAVGFSDDQKVQTISALCEGKKIGTVEWFDPPLCMTALDELVEYKQYFRLRIDIQKPAREYRITFLARYPFGDVPLKVIRYTASSVIRDLPWNSYYKNGCMIRGTEGEIHVRTVSKQEAFRTELRNQLCIWRSGLPYAKKSAVSRAVYQAARIFKRKQIWMVSDRPERAGDNGEAFFRYIQELRPKDVKAYFVLRKSSSDYEQMKQVGPVLDPDSKMFKLLYMLADRNVSSAGEINIMNPYRRVDPFYCDLHRNKPFVFLQHGVIKDDLSDWAGYLNKHFSGFVTSAQPEYESVLYGKNYHYTEKEVWLTGLPRFDRLYRDPKKKITVVPTWRKYLCSNNRDENYCPILLSGFENSSFFRFYSDLLNNSHLLDEADKYGYSLQILMHPNMMNALPFMKLDPRVRILPRDTKYREVYAESNLILTDYSSAIFDFVYLRQPIIYMHFDWEEFRSGEHTYKQGYFDYERDGFGEVEYDLKSVVDRVIEYMENGCQLKPKYAERIEKFFPYHDQKNSERVYNKVCEIDRS